MTFPGKERLIHAQSSNNQASRKQILFWFAVLVFLAILVSFAFFTTRATRENTLTDHIKDMDGMALSLARNTQRILFGADLSVTSLQENIEKKAFADPDSFYRYVSTKEMFQGLQEMVTRSTDIEALNFADANGRVVSSRNWPPSGVNISDRNFFIALKEGAPYYISMPILSRLTGQEVITFGRRIETGDGRFLGVVFVGISTHRFHKMLSDVLGDQLDHFFLFRLDGQLIAAQPQVNDASALPQALWRDIGQTVAQTNSSHLRLPGLNGIEGQQLLSTHNISGYPLSVAVLRPASSALSQWNKLSNLVYVFTAAAIALVLLAAYSFLRMSRAREALSFSLSELETANQRLTETQQYAQLGQWESFIPTDHHAWSDEMYDILELPRSATPSFEAFLALVHPEDRSLFDASYANSLKNKSLHEFSHRLLMPDGRIKHVIRRSRTELDPFGNPARSIGSLQDISELKHYEAELRTSHEKFQRLVEDIGDQYIIFSHHPFTGQLSYVSNSVERLMGANKESLLGKSWAEVVEWLPGEAERARQAVSDLVMGKTSSVRYELKLRLQDGSVHTIALTSHIVRESNGHPIAIEGILEDITERKQAEQELRDAKDTAVASRQMLQLVLNNIPVRVFWKNRDLVYLGCNKLFAHDAGFQKPEDLIGHNDFDMGWKAEAPLYRADDRLVIESGMAKLNFEEPQTTPDGQHIWLRTSKIPLRDKGETIGVLGMYEDITYQKKAEEELRIARNAAEASSRAKSAFLANMSHEIRTPMNAILGFAQLLLRRQPTDEQREKINRIITAGDHLLSLINNILDLSKIEAGHMILAREPFSPADLFSNLQSMFAVRLEARGIEFSIQSDRLPEQLLGDQTRLAQALINYLGNAEKFTSQGTIQLRARVLEESASDCLILFEVRDTGLGVPPEKFEKLFQAFEQADNTMTRAYGGSGLGLSITKSLAVLMGGDVGAKSKPGEGSTFWLTARFGKPGQQAREPVRSIYHSTPQRNIDFSGRRALLAEDEPANQLLAMEILNELTGLTIDLAEDGAAALKKASDTHYDFILMDMQMPVMNGIDATRKIRELPINQHTPIIAMTGNAFAEDRQRCFDAGMDDYIAKPFTLNQLFDAIARWLEQPKP